MPARRHPPVTPTCSPGLSSTAESPRSGSEGTGSYGDQLTRDLQQAGHHVVEVDRPDRRARRLRDRDDHLDRGSRPRGPVWPGDHHPQARDGQIEAIRALRVALRSSVSGHRSNESAQDAARQRPARAA